MRRGQVVTLNARLTDPDRDTVTGTWWQYGDADAYPGTVELTQAGRAHGVVRARLAIPRDAQPGQTIRLVLWAADDGTPSLTSYQRVVLTVRR